MKIQIKGKGRVQKIFEHGVGLVIGGSENEYVLMNNFYSQVKRFCMFWQGDHQNALSLNNVNEVREIKLSDNRSFYRID